MPAEEMYEQQRVDFFVSYTGADVAWAEWVAWVLEEAGLTTLVQAWDFRPGSNFAIDMHDALRRSERRVMPLLSEAYLSSVFGAAEWAEAFASDPIGHHGRLVPVRVGDCRPDGLLRAVVYVDVVGENEPEARRRLLAGVGRGRAKPDRPVAFPATPVALSPSRPFPGKLPSIWNVPVRNPNFAGRDAQLDELRTTLGAGGVAVAVLAISGLGGVGKSQLAIEHAWRRAADYDLVWWVPAEVPATLAGSLAPLAERLGLPTDDPAMVMGLLHDELRQRDRWLVVFDNAENPTSLAPYLPAGGGGQVLVTSRNPAWRSRGATVIVDVLAESEAVAFLLGRTGSDDEHAAQAVAEELGFLPLALEQAGAYVEETGIALAVYRELLCSRLAEVLARGTPAFHRETVAATFGLAYDRSLEENPAAAEVLGTCAMLAPDDIPAELLAGSDVLATEDALAVLRRLALVCRQGDSIAVHRLVGAVVRQRLGTDESAGRAKAAIRALRGAFPRETTENQTWPRSARLLPHVLAIAEHTEGTPELAVLLNSAAIYLLQRAELRPASALVRRALGILEAAYGPNHPEVARTLGILGLVLFDSDDLAGARQCQERALGIYEAAYGSDHRDVARTLSNLGLVLKVLGDMAGARERLERALRIKEAAFGPDDPNVAITLINLGLVLTDLGDLPGARERLERALRIKEAAYRPDDHNIAIALGGLGIVLRRLDDLAGAQELHERALAINEAAYGPNHPHVAIALHHLALVLKALGDLAGARERLERALRTFYQASYRADHANTRAAQRTLDAL